MGVTGKEGPPNGLGGREGARRGEPASGTVQPRPSGSIKPTGVRGWTFVKGGVSQRQGRGGELPASRSRGSKTRSGTSPSPTGWRRSRRSGWIQPLGRRRILPAWVQGPPVPAATRGKGPGALEQGPTTGEGGVSSVSRMDFVQPSEEGVDQSVTSGRGQRGSRTDPRGKGPRADQHEGSAARGQLQQGRPLAFRPCASCPEAPRGGGKGGRGGAARRTPLRHEPMAQTTDT